MSLQQLKEQIIRTVRVQSRNGRVVLFCVRDNGLDTHEMGSRARIVSRPFLPNNQPDSGKYQEVDVTKE